MRSGSPRPGARSSSLTVSWRSSLNPAKKLTAHDTKQTDSLLDHNSDAVETTSRRRVGRRWDLGLVETRSWCHEQYGEAIETDERSPLQAGDEAEVLRRAGASGEESSVGKRRNPSSLVDMSAVLDSKAEVNRTTLDNVAGLAGQGLGLS